MSTTSLENFDQLMAEVAAGSEDAIWRLAETYTPYIIRAVRSSLVPNLRRKLDSQDFAQALWASILLKPAALTRLKTPEALIAYLARAAKNRVIEETRRYSTLKYNVRREQSLAESIDHGPRSRQNPNALFAQDPTPSEFASLRERWNQILKTASDRDREILRMRFEGYTFDVISAKLRLDHKVLRRTIHRLIAKLME
jgi:RNA polymerase sigma-70 factor (ECF subfamily)